MADEGTVLRLTFFCGLIVAAFFYPLLWLVVIFGAGLIVGGSRLRKAPEPRPNFNKTVRRHISAGDPQWRERLNKRCESPAEGRFLEAMIDAFNLRPGGGVLQGSGVRLDLQVDFPPYRADFLAQGWLVIEIDGAAWHTSVEAIERDRQRDALMEQRGYRVLRIAAKTVFNNPQNAIASVRDAIAAGCPMTPKQALTKAVHGNRDLLSRVSATMAEINNDAQRIRLVRQAMAVPCAIFEQERAVIDAAMDDARRTLEIDAYIGNDPAKRRSFDEFRDNLSAYLKQSDVERHSGPLLRSTEEVSVVATMVALPRHDEPAIDDGIAHAYKRLMDERSRYLAVQHTGLKAERRLRPLVEARLAVVGASQLWPLIAIGTEEAVQVSPPNRLSKPSHCSVTPTQRI